MCCNENGTQIFWSASASWGGQLVSLRFAVASLQAGWFDSHQSNHRGAHTIHTGYIQLIHTGYYDGSSIEYRAGTAGTAGTFLSKKILE